LHDPSAKGFFVWRLEPEIMSTIDERRESETAAGAGPPAGAATAEKDLLEQLNCELRDLICSQMVLDPRQRLQRYGLTVEQMRKAMGS
jgi:hypothetical protein